jgi:hypothetical protein
MLKQDNNRRQGSQYDKIIRENLEVTLPMIVRDVLNLDVLISEELPDDIQHTKERKPDSLKKKLILMGIPMYCRSNSSLRMKKKWFIGWQNITLC